jgi:hypothetical protein
MQKGGEAGIEIDDIKVHPTSSTIKEFHLLKP